MALRNLANFHGLKNSDFILVSKMVELTQNKKSRQLDQSYRFSEETLFYPGNK